MSKGSLEIFNEIVSVFIIAQEHYISLKVSADLSFLDNFNILRDPTVKCIKISLWCYFSSLVWLYQY